MDETKHGLDLSVEEAEKRTDEALRKIGINPDDLPPWNEDEEDE